MKQFSIMKLSNLSFHLLPTTTAAAAIFAHDEDANIPATSRLGQSLLQNARSLGNNNNNNAQGGTSWLAGYSIKFHSCATGDYYGGGNNNNNEQNYDAQEVNNNNGFVYKQRLAHFQLCPSNTCSGSSKSGCNDYVTDLSDFLAMYVENKIEMEAMACENVKEICYCEDANDDELCYSDCYAQAGLSYCEEQVGGDNENGQVINLQEAVYCTPLDISEEALEYYSYNQNENNGEYDYNAQAQQQSFFVGPHCHNGKIILGLFIEETCSITAAQGSYEKMFFGQHLPYSSTSIVESQCMSCKVPKENDANANANNQNQYQNQNNNNVNGNGEMYYYKDGQMYQQQQQQQVYEYQYEYYEEQQQEPDEVTEACEQLYAQSAKCEESLHVNGVYPDTRACNYIRTLKKDGFGALSSLKQNVKNITSSVLAGVFAVTTVLFAGLSVYLNQKVKRSKVKLIHSDRTVALE